MIEAVLGALALILVTVIGYIFGRKKNTSEIKKNEADTKKSVIEAEKLDTENKLMQVELFERLNEVLSAQNEKLLKSNAKLVKSNEIVTPKQNVTECFMPDKSTHKRIYASDTKNILFRKDRNKWIVQIKIDNKRKSLGSFNTEEEAILKLKEYESK